ncbi:Protein of unknown function (DUF604) [Melia azedarach]|uniref:Uncharacterized protein n=1 Tax=Melia azedarach TaxID=155640 RepID=A0ACC1YLP3_MELAZ|nr:Protein of unknown function (DUF604) [Melia azedarach]
MSINLSSTQQNIQYFSLGILWKSLAISTLILVFSHSFLYNYNPYKRSANLFMPFFEHKTSPSTYNCSKSPTNISHIVFVLLGSIKSWRYRKPYIEAWWKKNITRGNLWLDKAPRNELLPWPSSSPPFRVNQDLRKWEIYPKLVNPVQVRLYHSILEAIQIENVTNSNKDVRWYVMGDDDTLFFLENLVEVLGKYDHTKYYYIGANSESVSSNHDLSFDMGFGGAGYALSYAFVEVLASKIEGCIERYPHLHLSDFMSHSCSADLGVDLTIEKGIHQIDLRGDISGLLSSHPNSPLISLHHFDYVDPIFPFKNRSESINHLMTAAKSDESRLLQQTICYHRQSNWSFSLSWGYSVHIYESIFPRSFLRKPLQTFLPWRKIGRAWFMFNTRWLTKNPCEVPHVFYLETVEQFKEELVVTNYTRGWPRNMPVCSWNGNHSADLISKIRVFSPGKGRKESGRIECCDVEYEEAILSSKEFLPWPSSSPPFRVNEDIGRAKAYEKIRKSFQIRVFRTILETFREGDKDVRWYVMADDDTILFVDNLVEVLAKYDHTQSLYIGTNSDCVTSNFYASFNMAFGGAGYALSYPLVEALATKLDTCVEKYQNLYASDLMLFSCLADFGVSLTPEKGFHQVMNLL